MNLVAQNPFVMYAVVASIGLAIGCSLARRSTSHSAILATSVVFALVLVWVVFALEDIRRAMGVAFMEDVRTAVGIVAVTVFSPLCFRWGRS